MSRIELIYNRLIIPTLRMAIKASSVFNPKLRKRENVSLLQLEEPFNAPPGRRIWFHSASMGEFEQAKPVIEYLKINYKDLVIIVSFFSPSGYENQKGYAYADEIIYLPFDKKSFVKAFLAKYNPEIAVFIRYEIWLNYLLELEHQNVPRLLICASFPGGGISNLFKAAYYKRSFNLFDEIYTIDSRHQNLFKDFIKDTPVYKSADTRFDRIIERVEKASEIDLLPKAICSKKEFIIVAGSTWEPDEKLLIAAFNKLKQHTDKSLLLIIVPHEPNEKNIDRLRKQVPGSILLSRIENSTDEVETIIVDSIGKLLSLYSYAHIAYLGGAFGAGVHSVTEPAGFALPVICGPKYTNSPDALNLAEKNALSGIKTDEELFNELKLLLTKDEIMSSRANTAKEYVLSKKGESMRIAERIAGLIGLAENYIQEG